VIHVDLHAAEVKMLGPALLLRCKFSRVVGFFELQEIFGVDESIGLLALLERVGFSAQFGSQDVERVEALGFGQRMYGLRGVRGLIGLRKMG
jgi:hypothetical protein